MLFNSEIFIYAFLPGILIGFFFLGRFDRRAALIWLLCGSLIFYGWWDVRYALLMIGSIGCNYACVFIMQRSSNEVIRKIFLVIGVLFNICILSYFKYTNFVIENLNQVFGTEYHSLKIILPIALSFYSFEQIASLVDAYKRDITVEAPIDYATFVTFFPRLVAGPIVRYAEIIPQFKKPDTFRISTKNMSIGITIFIIGLFKKVVIADNIAIYANTAFELAGHGVELTVFEGWAGALAYTFQLYFDFSAYSDMAIGLGRMFNITLPINFQSPYKSSSFIDFWRRWHITLSRFLRDYIYIPLGGNRKGKTRQYCNILITMLIGGLWHGAGWTFVLWGGIHGVLIVVSHLLRDLFSDNHIRPFLHRASKLVATAATFFMVVCAWVIFRAASMEEALSVFGAMFFQTTVSLPAALQHYLAGFPMPSNTVFMGFAPHFIETWPTYGNRNLVLLFGLLLGVCLFFPSTSDLLRKFQPAINYTYSKESVLVKIQWTPSLRWLVIMIVALLWAFSGMDNVQEFLYYQF